jgi:hypothetical protein
MTLRYLVHGGDAGRWEQGIYAKLWSANLSKKSSPTYFGRPVVNLHEGPAHEGGTL